MWRLHFWALSNLGNGWSQCWGEEEVGGGQNCADTEDGGADGTRGQARRAEEKTSQKGEIEYQMLLRHRERASRRQPVAHKCLFERLVGDVVESRL